MKRVILPLMVLACMGCSAAETITVEVSNRLAIGRELESVEVDWDDIEERLRGVRADNVVVMDESGREIPSQVLYDGDDEPEDLLFQATVAPNGVAKYSIALGSRESYKRQTYGRFVPERMDDFAWENNRVAYRVYGKALEVELFSPGIDVWMKRTSELILDKWYKGGHYHKDSGEGLDMYHVGRSLGAGSMTPIVGDELIYPSHNFTKYEIIESGDLRFKFKVEFEPFEVDGMMVEHSRTVTLDANTNLNIVEVEYEGDFRSIDVAVGLSIRNKEGEAVAMGSNYLAYTEPENKKNGTTYTLVITPTAGRNERIADHVIKRLRLKEDSDYTYLSGGFWSKYGVKDAAAWNEIVDQSVAKFNSPLRVKLK